MAWCFLSRSVVPIISLRRTGRDCHSRVVYKRSIADAERLWVGSQCCCFSFAALFLATRASNLVEQNTPPKNSVTAHSQNTFVRTLTECFFSLAGTNHATSAPCIKNKPPSSQGCIAHPNRAKDCPRMPSTTCPGANHQRWLKPKKVATTIASSSAYKPFGQRYSVIVTSERPSAARQSLSIATTRSRASRYDPRGGVNGIQYAVPPAMNVIPVSSTAVILPRPAAQDERLW